MRPFLTFEFPAGLVLRKIKRTLHGRELRRVLCRAPVDLVLWDGRRIRVAEIEPGFVTDGISWPWLFLNSWGKGADRAVLHDWMLELIRRGQVGRPKMVVDLVFFLALATGGVSFPRAALMFLGVRTRPFRKASGMTLGRDNRRPA